MTKHFFLILIMSLVTLIPRWLPAVFSKFTMPKILEEWVKCIPYAALSALIFPGIFLVDKTDSYVGWIGLLASVALALVKAPVYVVVMGAIMAVYGYYSW